MNKLTGVGLAVLSIGLIWWFIFYSQWGGPFEYLSEKIPCIAYTPTRLGCGFFIEQMAFFHAHGPIYQPLVSILGAATVVAGQVWARVS